MTTIKLVTDSFKPTTKQALLNEISDLKEALENEISDLKEALENEIKRADEMSDLLDQYEDNKHDWKMLVDRDDYESMENDRAVIDDINSLLQDYKIIQERVALGIVGEDEELTKIINALLAMEL